ncbi:ABC transporter ATP-binding protein [Desulfosediminicola flagellatus]|uniref:oligopeptide/dipeptide ABC transporter ATP-binding protein n=1 Tax=Desulfosediminicola flagellatus TaxID=2569541 RepID=UPI0010AD8B3E|nr:ABC transporter ATP-binding protein [Desulfosediminicola flagellatus]
MLEINNLSISFQRNRGAFNRETLPAVSDISLSVQAGEIVALIGASGAGKSLLAHALLGLLPDNANMSGEFIFKGEHISPARIRELRGREIALIPQSISHLNPLLRVRKQVYRSARLSGRCHDTADVSCDKVFSRYHLADPVKSMFPFQISGGMARRVLTATATSGLADLIIADEPTTGLDPEVTSQSLNHLRELAAQGKGVILITHDIENGARIADTIVVLYNGATVEVTPANSLERGDLIMHPYTRALWQSLPQNGFVGVPTAVAEGGSMHSGCAFAGNCPQARAECRANAPLLRQINGKLVRCNHVTG